MATNSSHRVIMGENVVSTLAPSFLIGSSSYLQVTRTSITSQMSSKFGQIGPRTAELAPSFLNQSSSFLQVTRTCMKAWMSSKFRPDTDTNTRVICPCASEKLLFNVVSTLAPSFLIGSSSYLQVTRTFITSGTSSKFGQIRPRTAELAALESLEKSP